MVMMMVVGMIKDRDCSDDDDDGDDDGDDDIDDAGDC